MITLDFKTVSPLFEMERDGEKPFTCRKVDTKDKRFRALSQWQPRFEWRIKITNPATGENFTRTLIHFDYLWDKGLLMEPCWIIVYLGAKIEAGRKNDL